MNKRIIAASVLMALAMFVLSGLATWVTFGAEDCERVAGTCIAEIPRDELVIVAEEPGASVNDVQSAVTAVRRAQPMHVSTLAVDALAIPELNTTVLWTRGGSAALPATLSSMRGVDVARPVMWTVDGSPAFYTLTGQVKNGAENFTRLSAAAAPQKSAQKSSDRVGGIEQPCYNYGSGGACKRPAPRSHLLGGETCQVYPDSSPSLNSASSASAVVAARSRNRSLNSTSPSAAETGSGWNARSARAQRPYGTDSPIPAESMPSRKDGATPILSGLGSGEGTGARTTRKPVGQASDGPTRAIQSSTASESGRAIGPTQNESRRMFGSGLDAIPTRRDSIALPSALRGREPQGKRPPAQSEIDSTSTVAGVGSAERRAHRSTMSSPWPGAVQIGPPIFARLASVATDQSATVTGATLKIPAGVSPGRDSPNDIPPTDPYYPRLYGLRAIGAADAWPVSTGSTAVVGIIDTGVDCRHADIGEACTDSVQHYDARARRWLNKTAVIDGLGHGTHVAGTCCAPANGRGVVGVAPNATIISFRACSSGGSCADLDIAAAVVASWGRANVINMSLGGPQSAYSRLVCDALHTARDEYGMLAIASVGNAGRSQALYPAACPGVVGVGSTDPPTGERVSSYSQRAAVDLVAPGRDILSTWLSADGDYATLSGTSMAAPHVTGVAALLYAASRERGNGDPRPVDVEKAMEQTARRICGKDYREDLCGWGLVQAGDAVRWIAPDQATATATDLPVEPTDEPDPWLVSPTPTITATATLDCALDPVACAVATARAATAEAAATATVHIVTAVPTLAPGTPTATRFWPPSSTPTRTSTPIPTPTTCADPLGCARATVTARAGATATERALRTAVAATVRVPTRTPVPPIETLVARMETAEACKSILPALPGPCRVIVLYYPIALAGPRATATPTGDAYPRPGEPPTPCDEGSTPGQCSARATRTAEAMRTALPTRCPGLVCEP